MITVALLLAFVAAACFALLALSLSRQDQRGRRPAPALRLDRPAPYVPQQRTTRVETVITQVRVPTPAQTPAHDRYAEVQALRAARVRRRVRLEL